MLGSKVRVQHPLIAASAHWRKTEKQKKKQGNKKKIQGNPVWLILCYIDVLPSAGMKEYNNDSCNENLENVFIGIPIR